jgi:hypothetical protein
MVLSRTTVVLLLGFFILLLAEARRVNTKKKSKVNEYFWPMIKLVYALVFLPVLVYFVYVVAKDPITPKVLVEGWQRIKVRFVSYLGTPSKVATIKKKA